MGSKWTLERLVWGCGVDLPGSGSFAGCCECGDEPLGSGITELVTFSTINNGVKLGLVVNRNCFLVLCLL
jgi:hypothetical protein